MNATVDAGIRRFVFSSTCAVYGEPAKIPITEDNPRQPVNPYGTSKLFCEFALEAYDRAYGLRSARLRYFNAAGADESGEIGELHNPETHLIPLALAATGNGSELKIFGTDYPTPDGTCVRDYIHVTDLADAHVRAFQHLEKAARTVWVRVTRESRCARGGRRVDRSQPGNGQGRFGSRGHQGSGNHYRTHRSPKSRSPASGRSSGFGCGRHPCPAGARLESHPHSVRHCFQRLEMDAESGKWYLRQTALLNEMQSDVRVRNSVGERPHWPSGWPRYCFRAIRD